MEDRFCTAYVPLILKFQVASERLWLPLLGYINSLSDPKKFFKQLESINKALYILSTLNLTLELFVSIYTSCFHTGMWMYLEMSQFHSKWIHVLEQHIRSFFKACYFKKLAIFVCISFLLLLTCHQENLLAIHSVERWGNKAADVRTALDLK